MKNNLKKPGKSSIQNEKKLQEQNEFLKLKLSAEAGADFHMSESIDPGLENAFLRNVLEFEKQYANAKTVLIHNLLGEPVYKKVEELPEKQLIIELERIYDLLSEHGIGIDFLADYPDREKYRFITEELFFHEADDISIPGLVQQYIYEEFHPNHKMDITNRSTEFINGWFKQDFSGYHPELADQWITDQRKIYSKKDVLKKFQDICTSYLRFGNTHYKILDVHTDVKDDDDSGMGYAEGVTKYDAVLENGESKHFEGPFKIYLRYENGWWNIFFAYWPGLEW